MISLKQYSTEAMGTALNVDKDDFTYPFLGLIGETGELCEKFKKVLRDRNGIIEEDSREAIIKELGDVCWYLNRILWADDITFEDLSLSKIFSEEESVHYCAIQLSTEVASLVVLHELDVVDPLELKIQASRILSMISHIAWKVNSSLVEVLSANIEKLYSRRERNVLMGSGDDR